MNEQYFKFTFEPKETSYTYSLHYYYSNNTVIIGASLVAQMVKNLPAMQDTPVRFLGQEDPLEEGMAAHSSILAWTRICLESLWTEGYSPWNHREWVHLSSIK